MSDCLSVIAIIRGGERVDRTSEIKTALIQADHWWENKIIWVSTISMGNQTYFSS